MRARNPNTTRAAPAARKGAAWAHLLESNFLVTSLLGATTMSAYMGITLSMAPVKTGAAMGAALAAVSRLSSVSRGCPGFLTSRTPNRRRAGRLGGRGPGLFGRLRPWARAPAKARGRPKGTADAANAIDQLFAPLPRRPGLFSSDASLGPIRKDPALFLKDPIAERPDRFPGLQDIVFYSFPAPDCWKNRRPLAADWQQGRNARSEYDTERKAVISYDGVTVISSSGTGC